MASAPTQHNESVSELEALVVRHPSDDALANLLMRVTTCRNGEAYVVA